MKKIILALLALTSYMAFSQSNGTYKSIDGLYIVTRSNVNKQNKSLIFNIKLTKTPNCTGSEGTAVQAEMYEEGEYFLPDNKNGGDLLGIYFKTKNTMEIETMQGQDFKVCGKLLTKQFYKFTKVSN